jgi:hypothetical protein
MTLRASLLSLFPRAVGRALVFARIALSPTAAPPDLTLRLDLLTAEIVSATAESGNRRMGKTVPSFTEFCARTQMRHDFADQIQVRYQHSNGEQFDTWVSGEEVQQRLKSASQEGRLRALRDLNWQQLREMGQNLPEESKLRMKDELQERLGSVISDLLGDNAIGDSLAAAARGSSADDASSEAAADEERRKWQAALQDDAFYAQVLELAWIQLHGSLPENDAYAEPTDWV